MVARLRLSDGGVDPLVQIFDSLTSHGMIAKLLILHDNFELFLDVRDLISQRVLHRAEVLLELSGEGVQIFDALLLVL